MAPTVEEYITLLRCPKVQADKAYSRAANVPTFLKKLMSITEMRENGSRPGSSKKEIVNAYLGRIYGI